MRRINRLARLSKRVVALKKELEEIRIQVDSLPQHDSFEGVVYQLEKVDRDFEKFTQDFIRNGGNKLKRIRYIRLYISKTRGLLKRIISSFGEKPEKNSIPYQRILESLDALVSSLDKLLLLLYAY